MKAVHVGHRAHRVRSTQCRRRAAAVMSLALPLCCAGMFLAPSPAFALATLSEIANVYRQQARELESLYVQYRIKSEALGPRAEIRRQLCTLFLEDIEKAFAFKGRRRYSKLISANGGTFDDLLATEADGRPKQLHTTPDAEYAFDGERLYYINDTIGGNRGLAAIVPADRNADSDDSYFDQEYLRWSFRMLPDVLGSDQERQEFQLASLIEAGRCRLRAASDTVDGAACVVIEWSKKGRLWSDETTSTMESWDYKVWCDPVLAYAVRKCEVYLASSGALDSRYGFSYFVEIAKGVWLPRKGYWDRYALRPVSSGPANGPLQRYSYEVSDIHANDVVDDLFTLSFPPGAVVRDERYLTNGVPIHYLMPANGKDLDATIDLALKGQGLGEVLPEERVWRRTMIGLLLLPLAIFAGAVLYRIRPRV